MTRSCPECGAPAEEDESFCGECGTYLEWEERPDAPTAPTAPPEDEPATSAPRPPAARRSPPVEPVQAPAPAPGATTDQGTPPQERVELRRPQAGPTRPRPRPRPEAGEEPLRPGDLICGSCGAGNTPTRKFCRRCGHELAEAEVVHVPWWRRILGRRRRTHAAGTRPPKTSERGARLSGARRALPAALVLVLLAVGAYAARPWLQEAGATVLDVVRGSEGFEASGVSATSAAPGHPARAIIDTDPTRFWAPTGDPRGESVTARFAEPQRLVHLVLSPGASVSKKAQWVAVGRPRTLVVLLHRSEGADETETVELGDEMGTVQVDLGVSDVEAVTLRLRRTYAGQAAGLTALGEVEFFVRK